MKRNKILGLFFLATLACGALVVGTRSYLTPSRAPNSEPTLTELALLTNALGVYIDSAHTPEPQLVDCFKELTPETAMQIMPQLKYLVDQSYQRLRDERKELAMDAKFVQINEWVQCQTLCTCTLYAGYYEQLEDNLLTEAEREVLLKMQGWATTQTYEQSLVCAVAQPNVCDSPILTALLDGAKE